VIAAVTACFSVGAAALIGPAQGLADQGGDPAFCPPLPFVEGAWVSGRFVGNHKQRRTLAYGRRSVIAGSVIDSGGFKLSGETVCVESRPRIPGSPYSMVGSTTTNAEGNWTFDLPSGPSRSIRVDYGGDPEVISTFLHLGVHAHATLHLQTHHTRPGRRIYFAGRIPGPRPGKRVVILRGTVPGARRKHLVRRGRTDSFGHFRIGYAFSRGAAPTRFAFWVVVPAQNGYPYRLGRSSKRFVRVRP
jgi:hypothetical protein